MSTGSQTLRRRIMRWWPGPMTCRFRASRHQAIPASATRASSPALPSVAVEPPTTPCLRWCSELDMKPGERQRLWAKAAHCCPWYFQAVRTRGSKTMQQLRMGCPVREPSKWVTQMWDIPNSPFYIPQDAWAPHLFSHPSTQTHTHQLTHLIQTCAAAMPLLTHYPGKCMSHTGSTYTFTTCRIMHPSDELTRVTPSVMSGPTSCVMTSSSSVRSAPCTPRRLSLSAESFTNLRDSTKTMSTSGGLVRLLQERGISAAVYNPRSWDRADASTPTGGAPSVRPPPPRPPDTLPSTPPNSPTHRLRRSKPISPVGPFDLSPSGLPYDNFLASKPASSILKEVRAEARSNESADDASQTDVSVSNLKLVDKLKRFSMAGDIRSSSSGNAGLAMLGPLGGLHRSGPPFGPSVGSCPIGGLPTLNTGIRRNRSYPAMVGASMAMKGPGPGVHTDILLAPSQLHRQTSLNDE
ncbi:hypothetical protein UPYG_G00155120 [Umbra pygmaea]|uniref:Uncharacterized protein n=1 Tax=Umbra pygmaea TaxID=75934 RepID=A0ABD0WY63_UMBPY